MGKEEEITRNLTMIEYYKEQLNSIDMQAQYLQAAVADFHKAKITVEQLHNADDKSEILIPVGGGVFLNGILTDHSKVLVDIGVGLVAEKTVDGAVKKIEERIKTLQENQERLMSMAQKLENEATELSQKTQQMMNDTKQ
jgi:prefoldin alpha subunit